MRLSTASLFGAQVTKNTTHGPFSEHGKRAHSVRKLEFSPAAAVTPGRDSHSSFEQVKLTQGSCGRRGAKFDPSGYVGLVAAILVPELPVKSPQGHPRILHWEGAFPESSLFGLL